MRRIGSEANAKKRPIIRPVMLWLKTIARMRTTLVIPGLYVRLQRDPVTHARNNEEANMRAKVGCNGLIKKSRSEMKLTRLPKLREHQHAQGASYRSRAKQ